MFYTACLGLCDVHVSKGRLLHLHLHQGLSLLWSSTVLRISLDRVPSTIYACCILHNKALDFKEVHASELEEPEGWQGRLPEIDAVSIEDIEAEEEATAQRAGEDFSTRSDAYIRRRGM